MVVICLKKKVTAKDNLMLPATHSECSFSQIKLFEFETCVNIFYKFETQTML